MELGQDTKRTWQCATHLALGVTLLLCFGKGKNLNGSTQGQLPSISHSEHFMGLWVGKGMRAIGQGKGVKEQAYRVSIAPSVQISDGVLWFCC